MTTGAALRAAVERAMARDRVPGVAVAVTDAERTLYRELFGLADVGAGRVVDPKTLFEIGSIGKTFTAIVLLQLAEEGRISLDDPVARHLPWFEVPLVGRPITVHDLLSHTAGINAGTEGTPEARFQVWALRDFVPGSAPGTRFHYSNVGYKALGLMIEAVDGRRYAEAVRVRVLEPLAMNDSESEIRHEIRPRMAVGYEYLYDDRVLHSGQPLVPAPWLETDTADGSIASTASDMAALARMLLRRGEGPTGRVLSEAGFESMRTAHATPLEGWAYGYGLSISNRGGRTYLGHGGGMVGYLAGLQVEPESGLGAVVLQNAYGLDPMALARTAIAVVRDGREPDPTEDEMETADLVGTYRPESEGVSPIEVVVSSGRLVVRLADGEVGLEDRGDRRFLAAHPSIDRHLLAFGPPAGPASHLWHGDIRFARDGAKPAPLASPDPSLLPIAGHYRSHNPWATNFRVLLRGDRAWLTFPGAPDGFDDEQPLAAMPGGDFQVGEEGSPERLAFDTVVEGRALRAWLSGFPYYRVD
jgi:CubicO group peptidase (beta-lactamase class C family)